MELKDLKIQGFQISRLLGDDMRFSINFQYSYANANGVCEGVRCKDEGACMDHVKQMLNNKWPG